LGRPLRHFVQNLGHLTLISQPVPRLLNVKPTGILIPTLASKQDRLKKIR
jgi:hypothetical protein